MATTRKTSSSKAGARPDPRESAVRDNFWNTAKRAAGKVPFMDEVVAAYYCALDEKTPCEGHIARSAGLFCPASRRHTRLSARFGLHR